MSSISGPSVLHHDNYSQKGGLQNVFTAEKICILHGQVFIMNTLGATHNTG